MVLPAEDHNAVEGSYNSEFGELIASTVRTLPLGRSVQPSSSLRSDLPLPVAVQVRLEGLNRAASPSKGLASMRVPLLRITLCASPIWVQPEGAATDFHVLPAGS